MYIISIVIMNIILIIYCIIRTRLMYNHARFSVTGHFGTRTVWRHETGAKESRYFGTSFFCVAELSRGHFGLVFVP